MASSAAMSRWFGMLRVVILAGLMVSGAGFTSASAETTCFSNEDTRDHVEKHGLIALHDVVRSARGTGQADLISARLCETNGNMVYMIAMLGRDGKLLRLTVDARTGTLINSR